MYVEQINEFAVVVVGSPSWYANLIFYRATLVTNMTKCTINKTDAANVAIGNISVSQSKKQYRLYSENNLYESLLMFFMQNEQEHLHVFAKRQNISRSSFRRFFFESGLQNLKESGNKDEAQARLCLTSYFEKKARNRSYRTEKATNSTRYLTDNEESAIVHLCRLLGSMGYGITRDELHAVINDVTNFDCDDRERVDVSDKVIRGLFSRHDDLLKIVEAASLDPKHAKQANTETRDAMFAKLDSYIQTLHAMGLVPWQNYQDIPPHCLYNMDELGNDTTKHRKKVIVGKTKNASEMRTFLKTPEGDGRMPWHITVCLTTRADGM